MSRWTVASAKGSRVSVSYMTKVEIATGTGSEPSSGCSSASPSQRPRSSRRGQRLLKDASPAPGTTSATVRVRTSRSAGNRSSRLPSGFR